MSLSCVLSLSQLCSILVLSVTRLIDHSPELLLTITQSLLSLLSSKTCNGQLLLHVSAVLELLCQKVFSLLDVSCYREVFLPTSSFFLTLSQCLNIRPVVNQVYRITCVSVWSASLLLKPYLTYLVYDIYVIRNTRLVLPQY